jgi:transketolase
MKKNPDIWVITGDLGYHMFDTIKNTFPNRFINVGAAEQSMIGIGVGLALKGKIPVCYSITPFLLYRPFETIRNYVNRESIPVKLIGGGRDQDYLDDGFSHWAEEDRYVMKILRKIKSHWPESIEEVDSLVVEMIETPKPFYINLKR